MYNTMFTGSSNGRGFYPTFAYPCAGCGASIYSSNIVVLSHNYVRKCTACLHGTTTFPYAAEEANPICGFPYGSSSAYVEYPPVPKFGTENGVINLEANNEITQQCEDEVDSWLLFREDRYAEVDQNLDLANYRACPEIEYQQKNNQLQPHCFQQGSNGTESIVPVQSMVAMKQPEQVHSFYMGFERKAFKAGFKQIPPSLWTAALPSTDACIVPDARTGRTTNLESIPPERTVGLSSNTAPIIIPQFCPAIREEKVLRYREKRKSRKFEKKIRYSSRKANAETRRRVRGRFARRSDMENKLDEMPSITERGNAIVPPLTKTDQKNVMFDP